MNQTTAGVADDLDPDIRRFQREVAAAYGRYPDFDGLPLAERRRIAEEVRAPWAAGGPVMHSTETLNVGPLGVRIRIHRPYARASLPVLIYVHGGGWTLFSLDTHDRLMREYAARAGIAVVGIDYSLSPEAKFPRALGEIVSVVRWLRSEGGAHGLDPEKMMIGGDSAGGNLSVAANLALLQDGDAPLLATLVNYGAFNRKDVYPSYARYDGPAYNLTTSEMVVFWANYLRTPQDAENPLACPMIADVRGLPPTFFSVGACDVLSDENRAMASRLVDAGVPVVYREYAGATHSFLEAVSISPLADRALADASAWLAEQISAINDNDSQ